MIDTCDDAQKLDFQRSRLYMRCRQKPCNYGIQSKNTFISTCSNQRVYCVQDVANLDYRKEKSRGRKLRIFEYETSFTFVFWYFSFAYIFYASLTSLPGKDKEFSYFLFLKCCFHILCRGLVALICIRLNFASVVFLERTERRKWFIFKYCIYLHKTWWINLKKKNYSVQRDDTFNLIGITRGS